MRVLCSSIFVLAVVLGGLAHAETIREIVVDENTKTDDDTVILISRLEVGDEWNNDMIEVIKERLVSSGLFKDVNLFSEPSKAGDGVKITILVKDKHSWVIAPAFYTQPTNIGGGVGFGENNLFGKNQKLLLYGQIATQDTFFIGAWVIPSIGGTRFYAQFDTFLKSQRNIEYLPPQTYLQTEADVGANKAVRVSRLNYLNAGAKLGIELFRGFKVDARFRAARVSYGKVELEEGATIEEVTGDPEATAVPDPGIEGWDVSTEFTATLDRRANWYGIASGYRYGVSFEQSAFNSDFRYYLVGANLYRAERILERHNLILRAGVGYGYHLPFQQEYLTGGTSMRGWLNQQFRGDFKAIANLEYSVPLFTVKGLSVRGLGFWDSGYTTFIHTDNPQRNYLPGAQRKSRDVITGEERSKFQQYFAPFKNSVGIGTRLYLRQIVLPLLGLDFGYGLEARDFQVYLAIGLTD